MPLRDNIDPVNYEFDALNCRIDTLNELEGRLVDDQSHLGLLAH